MDAKFDKFTREEIHFLRDIINLYVSEVASGQRESDPDGEVVGRGLLVEMHRSMKQRSETTR
jgi:hypothetical protein